MRFAEQYFALLKQCLDPRESVEELNIRTGSRIRAIPAGASFAVDLWDHVLPSCGLRKTSPHIAAAEAAWCFLGHAHVDWLRTWTKVWDDFADITPCAKCEGRGEITTTRDIGMFDGSTIEITCAECGGSGKTYWLEQAYGNRWRVSLGIDQLAVALKRLQDDPSDRRIWISSWDPSADILPLKQKTVPCPVGFTLSILGGRLNSTLMIRSSDLYMGLPYDVMRHALVMNAVARQLWVELGHMRVTLAHPHLYERHYDFAQIMLDVAPQVPQITMPPFNIDGIVAEPDAYVRAFKEVCAAALWPWYNPKSDVVR